MKALALGAVIILNGGKGKDGHVEVEDAGSNGREEALFRRSFLTRQRPGGAQQ